MAALEGVDQAVLLGDILALREAPAGDVLEAARPFFQQLGTALNGRRIVIVPGNHDHQLAHPLLERGRLDGTVDPLELRSVIAPGANGLVERIAGWTKGAEVVVAYPGLWIRPDVYATHGHYLDCHMTVPRLECLLAGMMQGLTGRVPERAAPPQDYEAVLAPIYAFAYNRAQAAVTSGNGNLGTAVWRRLKARGQERVTASGRRRSPSGLVGGALGVAGLAALRRAGVGNFRSDVSPAELGRAGVEAMGEVIDRLGLRADHVLFGHTHRPGPLDGETPWIGGGARLFNTGSWVYSSILIDGAPGPARTGRVRVPSSATAGLPS